MSSSELTEWMGFYKLEPWGGEFDYLGSAIVSATIANANRAKGSKALAPTEFIPDFRKEKQGQTPEDMIAMAALFTGMMGGQDLRPPAPDEGMDDHTGETSG